MTRLWWRREHTWSLKFKDTGEMLECRKLRPILNSLRPRIIPWAVVSWWRVHVVGPLDDWWEDYS